MSVGLMSPVAQAQAERIVAPEEQDAYVQEFFQDGDVTPLVDGSGGLTDAEIEAFHQAVRDAQQAGPLNDEIIAGEMLSDKIVLPPQVDKVTSDEAEVAVAKQQAQPQAFATTAATCHRFIFTAYDVCGAILQRYNQLGGLLSFLLDPIGPQIQNPDGVGFHQQFRNGFIFWHPDTGAHAIATRNAEVYQRNGWSAGWMGYPLGGEVPVSGSNPIDGELNGWVQLFQGGRIYRTPVLEGFQVASINGLILDKWLELGGANSNLGLPIADEAITPDGEGRFSTFQWGSIYWHPDTDAHEVSGLFYEVWAKNGHETGGYGYPLSDSYVDDEYRYVQEFEKETIDLSEVLEEDGTVEIGGIHVSEYFASMLIRQGIPLLSLTDLAWSASPTLENEPLIGAQHNDVLQSRGSGLPPWRACGINSPADKVIKSWEAEYGKHAGKTVDLTCGPIDGKGNGYFHIGKRHYKEWQIHASIEGISWMEVVDMAITKALTAATIWKNDPKNDTTCYSGQIYLINKRTGVIARTLNPSVYVSNGNNTVVTAFTAPLCKNNQG